MQFSGVLAEKRFGCGLSPELSAPSSPEQMLAGLSGPDTMATAFPIDSFDAFHVYLIEGKKAYRAMRKARGTDAFEDRKKDFNRLQGKVRQDQALWFTRTISRWSHTPTGLRERLSLFWADHFIAHGKTRMTRRAMSQYIETVIRPNLSGRFEDMLIAVTLHPIMLTYLDQSESVGPGSAVAQSSKRPRGLNENLAREVMELHTLGVGGAYTQTDVRELAELFTGLKFDPQKGTVFNAKAAEPGPETILGQTYDSTPPGLEPIRDALRDLARHPDTARHIAWKLAVHFVSDDPDPDLVATLAQRYRATDGDLLAVYDALLTHPAAWAPELKNIKPPFDFVASACRALAVSPDRLEQLDRNDLATYFFAPLRLMGQRWQVPPGPDGWPEEDGAWLTPQGLSTRLRWAMVIPANLRRDLPDPRAFLTTALGPDAPEAVQFAASAAERRMDGVGLVLSSPAFQRR